MTPEEILAECPELIFYGGTDHGYFRWRDTAHLVTIPQATLFAQARKEARKLREHNQHLQGQLNYFTGGPVNG